MEGVELSPEDYKENEVLDSEGLTKKIRKEILLFTLYKILPSQSIRFYKFICLI